MRIMPIKETAQRLGVSPLSLADKRYRVRLGLPAIKLGRRLGFDERDVEQLIVRGRERIPMECGQEVQPQLNELLGTARESHA
jgi:hypothetical protein